jgi:hypothetical protein
VPDAIVGPVGDVFFRVALEIETRNLRRAHAEEREASPVIGVDDLVRGGWDASEDTEPGEGIETLVDAQHAGGNGGTTDAVKAVATSDKVAGEFLDFSGMLETNLGMAVQIMNTERFGFEEDFSTGVEAGGDEIFDDFVLGVDSDGFAAGEFGEIDTVAGVDETQLDAVVHQTFALQTGADAGVDQEIDGAFFENAGADALLDIIAAASFGDGGFDSLQVEKMG